MVWKIALGIASLTVVGGLGVAAGATAPKAPTKKPTKAVTYTLSGTLTAAQETPKATAPKGATGTFAGTLSSSGKLAYTLTFKGLSGAAIAAHIHTGKKGVSGPIVVPICPKTCKSPVKGSATVKAAVAKAIETGGAYANVHTVKNPGGEIRAQIVAKKG